MPEPKIEPDKITRPFQLLAAWLSALVLLVGTFVGGAAYTTQPSWLSAAFGITAILMVPTFIGLIFVMQTRFRPQLQDDPFYAEYLKRQEKEFKDFRPENISDGQKPARSVATRESWEEREERRITRYQQNQGLFLVHAWRPSRTKGQVADIVIRLAQHGDGPLKKGGIKNVEYHLGKKFFDHPVVKTNAKENFALEVSAYGPMLCLARVNFNDGSKPLDLERYIDFPVS